MYFWWFADEARFFFISEDLHLCVNVIEFLVTAVGDIPHRRSANKGITLHSTMNPSWILH